MTHMPKHTSQAKALGTLGQLAFVEGGNTESVIQAAWLMSPGDAEEQAKVRDRFAAFCEDVRAVDRLWQTIAYIRDKSDGK